jgi:hypothetical protein
LRANAVKIAVEVGVDPLGHVKKLRKDYEKALDAAESRRVAYHQAVLDLIDHGGPHMRAYAEELGLLEQPEHPIIARAPAPTQQRHLARAVAGAGGVLVLLALALAALRLVHAPPFVQTVQVPRVLGMPEAAAVRRVTGAGLKARVVTLRRSIPHSLSHHVLGASSTPRERLAKGSTVTLYVAIAAHRR